MLLDIKRQLSACSLFSSLAAGWVASVIRVLDGMMFEYWQSRWNRERDSGPASCSLDQYLYFGRSSIGLPHVLQTSMILANDDSVLGCVGDLGDLAALCGSAMRLANDVRSFDREHRAGKLNSLDLLQAWPSQTSQSEAPTQLRTLVERELDRAEQLASVIRTGTGLEKRFVRGTRFGVEMYWIRDFRS
jgi:hypothetical protein